MTQGGVPNVYSTWRKGIVEGICASKRLVENILSVSWLAKIGSQRNNVCMEERSIDRPQFCTMYTCWNAAF